MAGPTPGMARTGIGEMKSSSSAGSRIRTPSGLAASLASLARNLAEPIPTEAVSPSVRRVNSSRSQSTRAARSPSAQGVPARSTNASSRLSGSTAGEISRSRPMTIRDDSRYASNRPPRNAAPGALRLASAPDMAERTPNVRAS